MKKGKVYLLGAGPGDIQLLTIKGKDVLQKADIIIYDRLANPKLLDFAKPDCELFFGGKLPGKPIVTQEELNQLLVSHALAGKIVVRLKSGDPGVFGRVSEEAEALAENSIDFEIIPGVTSGIAAPLYAGIPVTHREFGTSFAIVTAHGKSKGVDWKAVAGIDTVAFYMGVANLPSICENLIQQGKKPETPILLMQWGTYSRQKVLEGTLETITTRAEQVQFSNPAIILVGEIIKTRGKINWFEKKPLFGRQVLVARTSNEESSLARQLADKGADVTEFPKWRRSPLPVDRRILNKLADYQAVFFSSPDCVEDFFRIIAEAGIDVRQVTGDFYAGSQKSSKRLNSFGFQAKVVDTYTSLNRKRLIVTEQVAGQPSQVPEFFEEDVFWTAEKRIDEKFSPVLEQILEEMVPDTILFPNRASVLPFIEGLKKAGVSIEELMINTKAGCLGARTAQELAESGITTDYLPAEPKTELLIQQMIQS